MRIRMNSAFLPLTPGVLFSGVVSTLVTHLSFFHHHCPFLFYSLTRFLPSALPECTGAPNSEHILIILPGRVCQTGCRNLLSYCVFELFGIFLQVVWFLFLLFVSGSNLEVRFSEQLDFRPRQTLRTPLLTGA